MKNLVAAHESSCAKRMLAYFAAHDEWLGPTHQYTVLHRAPKVPSPTAAVIDLETLKGYCVDESEKVFKPIRPFFGRHGLAVTFTAKTGHAFEVIAERADRGKFDPLVMGSHGHGALGKPVAGSAASKVMAV